MAEGAWGMADAVAAFLGLSLVLYAVLAGADFGAGMWEALKGRRGKLHEDLVTHALGPVWEANHVWLILAIVILFNAFPAVFAKVSVAFHLPLTALLFGITARGCAFTFRHYDAVQDSSRRYYSLLFEASSILTPLVLGVVAGGMMLGRVQAGHEGSYYELFVAPWLNVFCLTLGGFVVVLFLFVAAAFLSGEGDDAALRRLFARRARVAGAGLVVAGACVFAVAEASGLPLARSFLGHPASMAAMALATLALWPLHRALATGRVAATRILASTLVALVLCGWFVLQYPTLLVVAGEGGGAYTVQGSAAPEAALRQLLIALVVGSALIFPALAYLLKVFKSGEPGAAR